MLAMASGAVGAGFFIYGIRQREPWTLGVGVALNVLPFVAGEVWSLLLLGVGVVAGGLYLKRQF